MSKARADPPLYILLKNKDYGPKGPLRLGSVLSSPRNPESGVDDYVPAVTSEIFKSWEDGHTDIVTSNQSNRYGLWTQFLQILGIGVNAAIERSNNASTSYTAARLDKAFFKPSQADLEDILKDPAIMSYLENKGWRTRLYVVTGIRIATRGASGSQDEGQQTTLQSDLSLDLTALTGAPVSLGPEYSREKGSTSHSSFGSSSPFVYAYRVKEIHHSTIKSRVVAKDVPGELHGIGTIARDIEAPNPFQVTGLRLQKMGHEWVSWNDIGVEDKSEMVEDGDMENVHFLVQN